MKTQTEKREWAIRKTADLKNKLNNFLNESFTDPEKMKALTAHYSYCTNFYEYSFFNSCLILAQGGTLAQSFKKWQEFGRFVKKGEKAHISIFVPARKKYETEEEEEDGVGKIFFLLKPVFDIRQTEGEPLKYLHNSEDSSDIIFEEIAPKIEAITGKPVHLEPMGEERGYCSPSKIAINESSNNTDRIKTLFHEAAHALLKHSPEDNKGSKEIEAEATAALVMSFFNVNFELSGEYIQYYKSKAGDIRKNAILKAAEQIIKAMKPEQIKEAA